MFDDEICKGLLTIHGEHGTKRLPYLPPGIDRAPQTPSEALGAAAAVLEEEGRWVQSTWYDHHDTSHPDYQDNPFCNGWSACAEGALQVVTIGAIYVPPNPDPTDDEPCPIAGCPTCYGHWSAPHNGMPRSGELAPEVQLFFAARRYLHELLGEQYGITEHQLPRFNDRVAQTRDDVIGLFLAAQRNAQEDEQGGNNTEDNK